MKELIAFKADHDHSVLVLCVMHFVIEYQMQLPLIHQVQNVWPLLHACVILCVIQYVFVKETHIILTFVLV